MKPDELYDIAAFGTPESIRRLMLSNSVFIDEIIYMGETMLGVAVRYKNHPVIQYLINRGANVNAYDADKGGEPPVKVAFDGDDQLSIQVLMSAGADLNLPGWMGVSTSERMRARSGK